MGGISAALQVLSTGSTLVYPTAPDVDTVLDTIERHNITNVVIWHMLAKLQARAAERGIDLVPIKITTGPTRDENGDPIPRHLQTRMLGMSESFAPHSAEPVTRRLPESKAGAAGRAVNGIERRVVDPATGVEVAPGEVGELQLRGGALMTGLYKVPRDSVFTPDGFFPTADLVRIDADGYAFFVGRISDMIKTNSANVSRLEVEAALNALPDVELAVVAGLPDLISAKGGRGSGSSRRTGPYRGRAASRLARDAVEFQGPPPHRLHHPRRHPRTPTGKVRLSELTDMVGTHLEAQSRPAHASSAAG